MGLFLRKEYAPDWEHILSFNSSPFKDVAFSAWKQTIPLKNWLIDTDTKCPFIAYFITKFETGFRGLFVYTTK